MVYDFPREYDAIILGTGLPESIIAAALSRVGKSILHLDRNDYYSSEWATFTFDGLLDWIKENEVSNDSCECLEVNKCEATTSPTESTKDNEVAIPLSVRSDAVKNIVTKSYFRTKRKEAKESPESSSNGGEQEIKNNSKDREVHDLVIEDTPQDVLKDSPPTKTLEMDISDEQTNETATIPHPGPSNSTDDKAIPEIPREESGQVNTTMEKIESDPGLSTRSEEVIDTSPMSPAKKCPKSKPAMNKDMMYEDFEKYFRQFHIDLAPKMLFSRGPLVEAIISANISHYAEFKVVNRILTYLNGNIEDVPCSRSDVFSSKLISAIEKRTLMKFLTLCIDFESHEDEYQDYIDKTFTDFLHSRRLSSNLQHFVLHSIAMVPQDADTLTCLKKISLFLHSLGRYGNTPFIWPLYGIGELPQAFCRMSAVFGGLYCLRRSADSIMIDVSNNSCVGITSEGEFLKCKWLIMGSTYLPMIWRCGTPKYVSRAVFITDKSLKMSEQGAVTLMSMPRTSDKGSPITVIELDKTSSACPNGLNVVHLVTDCCVSAEEDLKSTAEELLYFPQTEDDRESPKPVVLWSLYFNHVAAYEVPSSLPDNVYCSVLPGASLGFSLAMEQPKKIFHSICGDDAQFLPAIPNPEDIIMDDGLFEDEGNHAGIDGGSVSGQEEYANPPNPQHEEPISKNSEEDNSSEDNRRNKAKN